MLNLVHELFPIFRSITGPGIRETISILLREIGDGTLHRVQCGTPVFDWTVPPEWTVREAWITDMQGRTICDIRQSNLHLLHYSVPVDAIVSLDELKKHIHTLPDQPDLIPYRTGYYSNTWGFCLPHKVLETMADPEYRVYIDSTLDPNGELNFGEVVIPHTEYNNPAGEVLFSIHCCHPSLANDNLAAMAIAVELARWIKEQPRRHYNYRFLFIPGTIGSLTWLAMNHKHRDLKQEIKHGLVLSCLGDHGAFTYKNSRQGAAEIDRIVAHVLKHNPEYMRPHRIREFIPYGYDERQFGSPGFNLPVGCLMRTPNGEYPEYHTSGDNLDLISRGAMMESAITLKRIVTVIEGNYLVPKTSCPYGEPQLGKRGLYRPIGGQRNAGELFDQMTLLWACNLADGTNSILDMAERAKVPFETMHAAVEALRKVELLS